MKIISLLLAFIFSTATINTSYAGNGMISTLEVMDGISLQQDRQKILTVMEGKAVQEKMISMGINPQEAMLRVASLSSKEISHLSKAIDAAPAGGDGGVGTIVGAAVLVFIVLLVTDILGYTKVFPFTRSVN
ncbi:MAG: PA2779 family protein [Bdellovibrionales bacterium]|nr:PA2779 family protein [Bdellovibrionales bacterium]